MTSLGTELKCEVLKILGFKPTSEQVKLFLSSIHYSKSTQSLGDLKKAFIRYLQAKTMTPIDESDITRKTFLAFDLKGQGFITADDLVAVFKKSAPYIKDERVREMFREIDGDQDSCVTFKDFEQMMRFSIGT